MSSPRLSAADENPGPPTDAPAAGYFERFGFCPRQIQSAPHPELGLVVVIPCCDEPGLLPALDSLRRAEPSDGAVEILVVMNSSAACDPKVRARNALTLEQGLAWAKTYSDPRFQVHFLSFPELPPKSAGVGLARKIGMDEALRRFSDVHRSFGGLIAGFDADCQCDRGYFRAIESLFQNSPQCPGCSIYFEHPLSGPFPGKIYSAITAYELHLRYYIQALRFAGFPHAHHTVGSSFAVRAEVYARQGGMNKRQAGEDFYFLNKVIPLGGYRDLSATTIQPSPRPSNRVPFGTGRAVSLFMVTGKIDTYPWAAFLDLREFVFQVPAIAAGESTAEQCMKSMPRAMSSFLEQQQFQSALEEIRAHTATEQSFRKRFWGWFDNFRIMKFVHHARDTVYGPGNIEVEPRQLLRAMGMAAQANDAFTLREILDLFRRLDRGDRKSAP